MSKIIFSKPRVNSDSIIYSFLNLKNFVLSIIAAALLYSIINYSGNEKPIIWAFVIIIAIQILFSIIQRLKTNVYYVEMDFNLITIKYHIWNSEHEVHWFIKSTEINLKELRDSKGYFAGIELQFKNDKKKLKLKESIWDYEDFESIYFKFKKIKNESIPEDEKEALKQLQIMNDTFAGNF